MKEHFNLNDEPFGPKNISVVKTIPNPDSAFLYGNDVSRYVIVRVGINGETTFRSPILTGSEEQQIEQGREWLKELRAKLMKKSEPKQPKSPERIFTFE